MHLLAKHIGQVVVRVVVKVVGSCALPCVMIASVIGCDSDPRAVAPPAEAASADTVLPPFKEITAGRQFTCALDEDGTAWCWGANTRGQLGLGDTLDRFVPTRLQQSVPFVGLVAGESHVCATDATGALHCWGDNANFALGDTLVRIQARPRTAAVSGTRVVAAGRNVTCVIDRTRRTSCWGSDQHGERGDGADSLGATATPQTVSTSVAFDSVVIGRMHACALDGSGAAWCWGDGGALGDGAVQDRDAPVPVLGDRKYTLLAAGESVSCGLAQDSLAFCWGIAFDGQLGAGDPARPNGFAPVAVAGAQRFTAITAGRHRVCALDAAGAAWCWGSNYNGGLGNNSGVSSAAPVRVQGTRSYTAIAAGDFHTCALDRQGEAWCWGQNADARSGGALGDGTVRSRSVPTRVSSLPSLP